MVDENNESKEQPAQASAEENNEEVTEPNIPSELLDSKQIKTKITTLSKVIEDKLMQLKDLATIEVLMPVSARIRERLKSIKEMSSAKHLKIRGHWKTQNPKMHITKLEAKKINNDEAEITFSVYETDKKGNKVLYQKTAEVQKSDGTTIKRVVAAEYKIVLEVIELIKTNRPITREIIKLDIAEEFIPEDK